MANKSEMTLSERNILIGIVILSLAIFGFGIYFNLPESGVDLRGILRAIWIGWQYWLGPVYAVLGFGLVGLSIYCWIRYWPLRPKVSIFESPTGVQAKVKRERDPRVGKYWNQIVTRANTGTPENLRLSILEADALIDFCLKKFGYEGEHMADRLSQIDPKEIKSLERLWRAHRLRNDIVHTPGYTVSPKVAEEALRAYQDFLIELDAF